MSDIDNMEKDFLKGANDFNKASLTVIVELQEQIESLKVENDHLKKLLENNIPLIDISTNDFTLGISNERIICETQLANLRAAALVRDLTLEETRKFQAFVDVLEKIKKAQPNPDIEIRKLPEADLLKVLENTNG